MSFDADRDADGNSTEFARIDTSGLPVINASEQDLADHMAYLDALAAINKRSLCGTSWSLNHSSNPYRTRATDCYSSACKLHSSGNNTTSSIFRK